MQTRKMKINSYIVSVTMVLLLAMGMCKDIDLEGRPTVSDEDEVDIFGILSKQKVETATGRSVETPGKIFQGDIMVNEKEKEIWNKRLAGVGLGRSTTEDNLAVLLWPRKIWTTREVPYMISHSSDAERKIVAAMRDLESKVRCLKFRRYRSGDKAWLNIHRGSSCWAGIGRSIGFGKTDVSLGRGCLSRALIQHEIIHALGFYHEQSRRDRDNYVRVLKYNIQQANLYNFDKSEKGYSDTFGVPYDYDSIMHYSRTTWTKNGRNTMEAKNDPNRRLGGSTASKYDIMKLNLMYHCHEKSAGKWTEWSDWSNCIKTYKGCYRAKHRICLVKACPGADDWGVQSKAQKCPSPRHCEVEPVDGFWGSWFSWSQCSKKCDKGMRTRSRKCNSPKPSNGGRDCKGSATDTEKCMLKTCRKSKYFANFDDGFGMWSNVKNANDPLDWRRGRGRTSSNSGPDGDHTTGRGWYLYVSSSPAHHQKRATLVSEYLTGYKCISLAYCMNGKSMGSLEFFTQQANGQYAIFPKKKKGHQGKGWHHIQFSLTGENRKKYSYRFFIEAKTGYGPYSDIAIDDILIENGACGSKGAKPVAPASAISEGCTDKNKDCMSWSKRGECSKNPAYMLETCCLSCRRMKNCKKDTYDTKKCSEWAKGGECGKNEKWMWDKCCKSCLAQHTRAKCPTGKNSQCVKWAIKGECGKNEWMLKNCCKSCSLVKGPCIADKYDRCGEWANKGECLKNREWMIPNCCKSCSKG